MKKTKIICTLGPSTNSVEIISAMADAGMDVARLNFSHGTYDDHKSKINMINKVREENRYLSPYFLIQRDPSSA